MPGSFLSTCLGLTMLVGRGLRSCRSRWGRFRRGVRLRVLGLGFGGDEFALLLPAGHDAPAIAGLLLDVLGMPILAGGTVVQVGASIGLARCPEDGRDETALLRAADTAMYNAKRAGRGRFTSFGTGTAA